MLIGGVSSVGGDKYRIAVRRDRTSSAPIKPDAPGLSSTTTACFVPGDLLSEGTRELVSGASGERTTKVNCLSILACTPADMKYGDADKRKLRQRKTCSSFVCE